MSYLTQYALTSVSGKMSGLRGFVRGASAASPPLQGFPLYVDVTGAVVAPRRPSHGFCASLNEGKAKFAETCRA
jgi:hypothetical protein